MMKVISIYYERIKSKKVDLKYYIAKELPVSIYMDEERML